MRTPARSFSQAGPAPWESGCLQYPAIGLPGLCPRREPIAALEKSTGPGTRRRSRTAASAAKVSLLGGRTPTHLVRIPERIFSAVSRSRVSGFSGLRFPQGSVPGYLGSRISGFRGDQESVWVPRCLEILPVSPSCELWGHRLAGKSWTGGANRKRTPMRVAPHPKPAKAEACLHGNSQSKGPAWRPLLASHSLD